MRQTQGAYADVVDWVRVARDKRIDKGAFALRAFRSSFFFGVLVISVIGLLSPAALGQVGAAPFRGSWPMWVFAGLVVLCLAVCWFKRDDIRWTAVRIVDPWRRPMEDDPNYAGLADALELCSETQRSRFAWSFVWGPLVVGVLATACAFASAWFLLAAISNRFVVGWGFVVQLVVTAALSAALWRVAVTRLATWRVAASAYKTISTGYL